MHVRRPSSAKVIRASLRHSVAGRLFFTRRAGFRIERTKHARVQGMYGFAQMRQIVAVYTKVKIELDNQYINVIYSIFLQRSSIGQCRFWSVVFDSNSGRL
jgi:hypothetical protein